MTNQGSAADTNLRLEAELEPQLEFVSGSGPTSAAASGGGTVVFAPLASIAAKEKAVWQLRVRAVGEGDVRTLVMLRSDNLVSGSGRPDVANVRNPDVRGGARGRAAARPR